MEIKIVELTPENINDYALCGYRDSGKESFQKKAGWLKKRFSEGLRYKVLYSEDEGSFGTIEYVPGEYAWRPVRAKNYMFIHCISLEKKKLRKKGLGWMLVQDCIDDARANNMDGVAVVTRKGSWMAGPQLFIKHGFSTSDSAKPDFELLALRFSDVPLPSFRKDMEEDAGKYGDGLVILYSDQCPYISKFLSDMKSSNTDKEFGVEAKMVEIKSAGEAQECPSTYGIFTVLYNGRVLTTNPISNTRFKNILNKEVAK